MRGLTPMSVSCATVGLPRAEGAADTTSKEEGVERMSGFEWTIIVIIGVAIAIAKSYFDHH
ncbi:MAG: hypothetical protein JWP55_4776 [Mycobacterium sp.]|nr:hypothetical protein [Mycobacterium sp.]